MMSQVRNAQISPERAPVHQRSSRIALTGADSPGTISKKSDSGTDSFGGDSLASERPARRPESAKRLCHAVAGMSSSEHPQPQIRLTRLTFLLMKVRVSP